MVGGDPDLPPRPLNIGVGPAGNADGGAHVMNQVTTGTGCLFAGKREDFN